jgi:signal transduction histidine kinase
VGWALLLSGSTAAATVVCAAVVLHLLGRLDAAAVGVLAVAGLAAGVPASAAGCALARRFTAALVAVQAGDGPDGLPGTGVVRSRELAGLARSVATLRWRLGLSDELAERRRVEALTAAAGVQELVAGLVAAEEGARGQLAAELHDTVAQSLLLARGLLAGQPLTPPQLATLADHLEDAEEQVRAVMSRTRPPALQDGDLAQAVSSLQADVAARYGLVVDLRWPSRPVPVPLAAAVTVYRFFQEALLNVVKHADVDEAAATLEVLPDGLLASVHDRGSGFELELVRSDRGRSAGLGLLRERARLSGGRLDVSSGRGHEGTLLQLWLPRPAPSASQGRLLAHIPAQRSRRPA